MPIREGKTFLSGRQKLAIFLSFIWDLSIKYNIGHCVEAPTGYFSHLWVPELHWQGSLKEVLKLVKEMGNP